MTTYYHGGFPNLHKGDKVLPSSVTGAPCTANFGAAGICLPDRVYVTTSRHAAMMYGAMHPSGKGRFYKVEPKGTLKDDPDCDLKGLSYECDSCVVLSAFEIPKHIARMIRRSLILDL